MLPEEEDRIRHEEILRLEIRRSIEAKQPPQSRWEKSWTFFNSALGLWLLSTVAVTILGWAFAKLSSTLAHERENSILSSKLDMEIANHVREFRDTLTAEYPEGEWQAGLVQLLRAADCLQGKTQAYDHLFPEYQGRTTSSLIWELREIRADRVEKGRLLQAYQASHNINYEIHNMVARLQAMSTKANKSAMVDALKQAIIEVEKIYLDQGCPLMDRRWIEQISTTTTF
jgi:hypothetical protein